MITRRVSCVLVAAALVVRGVQPARAQLDNPDDPTFSHHPLWETFRKTTIRQAPPDYLSQRHR